MVLPALTVIAEAATSEANRTITVPLAEGVSMPSIVAILSAALADAVFAVVGVLTVLEYVAVWVSIPAGYSAAKPSRLVVGAFIDHSDPVLAKAAVYMMWAWNL